MKPAIYFFIFLIVAGCFLLSAFMNYYLFFYSPNTLLIAKNFKKVILNTVGGLLFSIIVATFFTDNDVDNSGSYGISILFSFISICYFLYNYFTQKFLEINLENGTIILREQKRIKVKDVLYIELYSYDSGGYIQEYLNFVLNALAKVRILKNAPFRIDLIKKELATFLGVKLVDDRNRL
jgi:hypothetical protein